MHAELATPPAAPPPTRGGRLAAALVLGLTAIAFWPVLPWLAREIAASQQIRQSFVLLGAAAGLVAYQHARELRLKLEIGNRSLVLLVGSYACVALALWTKVSLFTLPAFALALAGGLHIAVGDEAWRFLKPLFIGFVACLATILLFPLLDWPLRTMAGVNAARLLKEIGFAPELAVVRVQPDAPVKLILSTGKRLFEVATECNGFGLITSGMVLALLAAGIAGRRALAYLWLVPLAAATGFVLNLLRILAICLLAPYFPQHYHLLHETAGVIMLWSGLGLVGWLAWRPALRRKAQAEPVSP